MTAEMDSRGRKSTGGEAELETALDAYVEAHERGAAPDPEPYCRPFGAKAGQLRRWIDEFHALSEALSPDGAAGGGGTSAAPQVIGRYRILEELGRGGMGIVYLAEQEGLRRIVALKTLPIAHGFNPQNVQRFRREMKIMGGLDHPGIVTVLDAGEADGRLFLAMEYVKGRSLEQLLAELSDADPFRLSPEDLRRALGREARASDAVAAPSLFAKGRGEEAWIEFATRAGAEVAEALEFAHAAGVIHRDIKPGNVLIDAAGRARLLDFGLSCLDRPGIAVTGGSTFAGTPAYMSPEQILTGRIPVDGRTDVYSLGATLYHLLTLRLPFAGNRIADVFRAVEWDDPPAARRLNPAIPRDLEKVLSVAMAKNPARRYPTAGALAADLRRVLRFEAVTASGTSKVSRWGRKLKQHRRRVALIGVAGLLMLALGAWFLNLRAERAAGEAERQARRSALAWERIGAVEAALGAEALPRAESLLRLLTLDADGLPEVEATREELERQWNASVSAALLSTTESLAQGRLRDAAKGLAALSELEGRLAEITQLRQRLQAAESAARHAAGLLHPDPEVRAKAVREWSLEVESGVARPEDEPLIRQLLLTETVPEVLEALFAAVLATDPAGFTEELLERYEGADANLSRQIALCGALSGDRRWIQRIHDRWNEWMSSGQDRWFGSSVSRKYYSSGNQTETMRLEDQPGFEGLEVDDSGSMDAVECRSGMAFFSLAVLGDPDLRMRAEARLEALLSAGRFVEDRCEILIAARLLAHLDDRRAAPALRALALADERALLLGRSLAVKMLARWHEPDVLPLARLLQNLEPDEQFAVTAAEVAGHLIERPEVRIWIEELLESTTASDLLVLSVLTAVRFGPPPRFHQGRIREWGPQEVNFILAVTLLLETRSPGPALVSKLLKAAIVLDEVRLSRPLQRPAEYWFGNETFRVERAEQILQHRSGPVRDRLGHILNANGGGIRDWGRVRLGESASETFVRREIERLCVLARESTPAAVEELSSTAATHPALQVRRISALLLAAAGQLQVAEATLRDVRALLGPDPEMEFALARCEAERGELELARSRIQATLAAWNIPSSLRSMMLFSCAEWLER